MMERAELIRLRDRLDTAVDIARAAITNATAARLDLLADAPDLGSLIVAARDGGALVEAQHAGLRALLDARADVEAAIRAATTQQEAA